ncbi:TIGR03364 family FAD-dependent oxidoreductase [Zhouia sp. PK063]|uniref:TIGR03364 family FAD-dependent oxidoreductase n=1 Tax=Zhouia sp. PK063 TaxID=3373602 RepID=UPI0037AC03A0
MQKTYDIIVIGGGVLGTFHAYHAAEKGKKVLLLEKDAMPVQSTVRNFGQVVPSGMNTKWQQYGKESLHIYKEIQQQFDISVRQNGSVYLASNTEELQLLEELNAINQHQNYTSQLLTKNECLNRYEGLKDDYVIGGLFFPEEITIEPRIMISKLQQYLIKNKNIDIKYSTSVKSCDEAGEAVLVETTSNKQFKAQKVIICNGSEFQLLYPEIFNTSDIEVVKLQMLQTKPQQNYTLNGSILTGWSIRRYEAFTECHSFNTIKSKEPLDSLQKKWGVHILFKQATDGSIILGDSHHYASVIEKENLGFDIHQNITEFMIEEAKKIIKLPNYNIQNQWIGIYSQCKTNDIFLHNVSSNIHIVTAIGGKGMTGSAGFAKQNIHQLLNF